MLAALVDIFVASNPTEQCPKTAKRELLVVVSASYLMQAERKSTSSFGEE
jgi:hypothetical protein